MFSYPFSPDVQQAWQPLQLQGQLQLSLRYEAREQNLLLVRPSAPQMHIVAAVQAGRPVHPHWNAVSSWPGSVHITLHALEPGCVLAGSGCSGQIPFKASKQPWQFCVHGDVSVTGLPPSQPCIGAAFLLQNMAAIAAGWTGDM